MNNKELSHKILGMLNTIEDISTFNRTIREIMEGTPIIRNRIIMRRQLEAHDMYGNKN